VARKKKSGDTDLDVRLRQVWCCIDQLQYQCREYAAAEGLKKRARSVERMKELNLELNAYLVQLGDD